MQDLFTSLILFQNRKQKLMSFFTKELILLYLPIWLSCEFINIIIALSGSLASKVEDTFLVSIKKYYYNFD